MLYCTYRNGRYEAELPDGRIIDFEDMDEMIRFLEQRWQLHKLVGHKEESCIDVPGYKTEAKPIVVPSSDKKKKIRIHKGVYTVINGKLVKKKTA